jgi:hypothetical protein
MVALVWRNAASLMSLGALNMYMGTYHRLRVHVWASDVTVLRAAHKRLSKAARRNPKLREQRKRFYREMLDCHRSARGLAHAFAL